MNFYYLFVIFTIIRCILIETKIWSKINFYLNNPHAAIEHGINGRKFVVDNFQQEIIWREIENKIFNLTV